MRKGTQALLWVGGGLLAAWALTRDGKAGPPIGPTGTGKAASRLQGKDYTRFLWEHARDRIPELRKKWNLDSLKSATIAAAEWYDIQPEILWGAMWGESKHHVLGLFGANASNKWFGNLSVSQSLTPPANDYGIIQITRDRFNWEKKNHPERIPWEHWDVVDPERAIYTMAASFKRLYERNPNPTLYDLGYWWPQTEAGAKRKAQAMEDIGPRVWVTE